MPLPLARSLAAALILCSPLLPSRADAADKTTVFAAASLKNALDGVVKAYGSKGPVVVSYAASSALAKQIEKGAPADIFVSADVDWMDYLAKKNLIKADTRKDLLGGHLVLIAPAGKLPAKPVTFPGPSLQEALGSGRLAMADVKAVPAGKYGKAALEKLGLWDGVKDKVSQAENVRAALAFVARGEAPLGIVYQTDAVAEPKVKLVAKFPDDSHAPILYPVAIVKSTPSAAAASDFLKFVESPDAAKIFEKQGFDVLH